MDHHRTPAREDKRLWVTAGTLAGLFALAGLRIPVPEPMLGAILVMATGFIGVSQYGQTKRFAVATGGTNAPAPAAAAVPAP